MEGGDWRQGDGGAVNDCMSGEYVGGWCWGGVRVGDMISQGGLEEVRVGLTCMRIKQCWEVVGCGGFMGGGGWRLLQLLPSTLTGT